MVLASGKKNLEFREVATTVYKVVPFTFQGQRLQC